MSSPRNSQSSNSASESKTISVADTDYQDILIYSDHNDVLTRPLTEDDFKDISFNSIFTTPTHSIPGSLILTADNAVNEYAQEIKAATNETEIKTAQQTFTRKCLGILNELTSTHRAHVFNSSVGLSHIGNTVLSTFPSEVTNYQRLVSTASTGLIIFTLHKLAFLLKKYCGKVQNFDLNKWVNHEGNFASGFSFMFDMACLAIAKAWAANLPDSNAQVIGTVSGVLAGSMFFGLGNAYFQTLPVSASFARPMHNLNYAIACGSFIQYGLRANASFPANEDLNPNSWISTGLSFLPFGIALIALIYAAKKDVRDITQDRVVFACNVMKLTGTGLQAIKLGTPVAAAIIASEAAVAIMAEFEEAGVQLIKRITKLCQSGKDELHPLITEDLEAKNYAGQQAIVNNPR